MEQYNLQLFLAARSGDYTMVKKLLADANLVFSDMLDEDVSENKKYEFTIPIVRAMVEVAHNLYNNINDTGARSLLDYFFHTDMYINGYDYFYEEIDTQRHLNTSNYNTQVYQALLQAAPEFSDVERVASLAERGDIDALVRLRDFELHEDNTNEGYTRAIDIALGSNNDLFSAILGPIPISILRAAAKDRKSNRLKTYLKEEYGE